MIIYWISITLLLNKDKKLFYEDSLISRDWLTDGVQELKSNSSSTHTVCQADHFTIFAVLMQHRKIPVCKEMLFCLLC